MLIKNLPIIVRMLTDRKVKDDLKKMHNKLSGDKLYSKLKMFKIFYKLLSKDKLVYHNGIYYLSFVFPAFPSKAMFTFLDSARDKDKIFTSLAYCKKTAPLTICLTITTKCNYNCYYCGSKSKNKNDISTEQWKVIIKDLQKMNTPVIFFTGGEPLLHNDLEELCKCVTDKSLLYILTTGDGVTTQKAKQLKEWGVFGLGISLTTCDEAADIESRNHNKSYENAVNAIQNSVKAGLFTTIITVLPKNKLDENSIFKFIQFVEDLGANEVILKEPVKVGKLLDDEDKDIYYMTDEDKLALINIQNKANKKFKKIKVSTEFLYACKEGFGCSAGLQHSAINSNGDLTPCDFCPISFGNVTEEPLDLLWTKMADTIDIPVKGCLQMDVFKEQYDQDLPLSPEKTMHIIEKYKASEYADMYKYMQK